jgi:DNA adenine methylase
MVVGQAEFEVLKEESMATPFIKWPGGKRRQLADISAGFADLDLSRCLYVEPFLGGGAVGLAFAPRFKRAHLSDYNADLMGAYTAIRDDPQGVWDALMALEGNTETLWELRKARFNSGAGSALERAALLVFLSRYGFNGLWRTNQRGEFNVSWGGSLQGLPEDQREMLFSAAEALRQGDIRLEARGVNEVLLRLLEEDLSGYDRVVVYLDPPYVTGASGEFTGYSAAFGVTHLNVLSRICQRLLAALGDRILLLVSQPACALADEAWGFLGKRTPIRERRSIGASVGATSEANEYLYQSTKRVAAPSGGGQRIRLRQGAAK